MVNYSSFADLKKALEKKEAEKPRIYFTKNQEKEFWQYLDTLDRYSKPIGSWERTEKRIVEKRSENENPDGSTRFAADLKFEETWVITGEDYIRPHISLGSEDTWFVYREETYQRSKEKCIGSKPI